MTDLTDSLLFDTDVDSTTLRSWFATARDNGFGLVTMTAEHVAQLQAVLSIPIRRCYITDALLDERATSLSVSRAEILAARLPDAGSTMAGDFGEVLAYLYHLATEHPKSVFGPKKWRLKQDRTKPAPHSDVIHFSLPNWPTPSDQDELLCSEVKTKSTDGNSKPISSAIEDSGKDSTSRLARTLVWLRERALGEDLDDVSIAHLNRFINATDHPRFQRRFFAVAVICETLVDAELSSDPPSPAPHTALLLIVLPDLKSVYAAAFEAVRLTVGADDEGMLR